MRILDTFCGAGGAAMGYHRAGFDVVGVDIKRFRRYPFPQVVMDALEALAVLGEGGSIVDTESRSWRLEDFDAIHASPPCQLWVDGANHAKHRDLITPTRGLLEGLRKPFVIENVDTAPLRDGWMLCGTMFGLPLIRHRRFEVWPRLTLTPPLCNHWGKVSTGQFAAVYRRGGKGPITRNEKGEKVRAARPLRNGPSWQVAMGINWMTKAELTQAIPPAYTEYIGKQLLAVLDTGLDGLGGSVRGAASIAEMEET